VIKSDVRCTRENKCGIAKIKAAFIKEHNILTNKLDEKFGEKSSRKAIFLPLLHMVLKIGHYGNYIKINRVL